MIITNLFSIFDPSLRVFSFSWFIIFLVLLILPSFFWLRGSLALFFFSFGHFIKKEVDYSMKSSVRGVYLFVCSIFLIVGAYNFLALFPHLFSLTSHMLVTLPFSFRFWLSVVFFS
jgi:hypothetical protein